MVGEMNSPNGPLTFHSWSFIVVAMQLLEIDEAAHLYGSSPVVLASKDGRYHFDINPK